MAKVKILVEGSHEKVDGGFNLFCTTTLIKSDKNIIVDPGAFINEKKLLEALKKEGLTPDDIDVVLLTHTHIDHTTNTHLFKNSKITMKFAGGEYAGQTHTLPKGFLERADLIENPHIAKDVSVIFTPGHTLDMMSVVVKTDQGTVVITGDAIRVPELADLSNKEFPFITADMEAYEESRKKILEIADYIIPGHGPIIKIEK